METNLNWIVYCTVNVENRHIYIGVHKNYSDKFDGYLGCGVHIGQPSSYMNPTTPFQYAVKKYGVNKFYRITLKDNLSKEEAFEIERAIVDESFIKRSDVYNASVGGNGGKKPKTIYQFNLQGEFIKAWFSVEEVSDYYGLTMSHIYQCAEYKTSGKGYY